MDVFLFVYVHPTIRSANHEKNQALKSLSNPLRSVYYISERVVPDVFRRPEGGHVHS